MPNDKDNIQRDLTDDDAIRLFSEMIVRIRANNYDNPYFTDCRSSPLLAKQRTQEVANELKLGVTLPDQNIVAFLPGFGAAKHCHIFSVKPKVQKTTYNVNDFLRCCYPQYNPSAGSTLPVIK